MVFTGKQNMGNRNDDQMRIIELEKRPRWDFGKRKFIHVGINKSSVNSRILNRSGSANEEVEVSPTNLSTRGNTYGGYASSLGMRAANKQWVHPPEALLRGHIVYNVKFLGECEVENPKGTDVVKEAIRKRKFNKHIRKAEGQKTPKVELTISADGVTVQDPKTKMIMHQYALHRISYCADDKSDKRMFTFIAKAGDTNQHYCYVFDSEKCAEEITLTIGQAFDLAYRKFLDTSGRDFDLKKQYLMLQKKVQTLEKENLTLRLRVQELEKQKEMEENQRNQQVYAQDDPNTSNGDLSGFEPMEVNMTLYGPDKYNTDKHEVEISDVALLSTSPETSAILTLDSQTSFGEESTTDEPEYSTPNNKTTGVGRRLENLLFEADTQPQSNGVTSPNGQASGILSPPPSSTRSRTSSTPVSLQQLTSPTQATSSQAGGTDMFGSAPFVAPTTPGGGAAAPDPFGMGSFTPNTSQDIDKQIMKMDKDFLDLQAGFNQGLSFGTEDFSLADLDPLSSK